MARDGGAVQGAWHPSRRVLTAPALDLCRVGAPL
jgi:hypothetical protein